MKILSQFQIVCERRLLDHFSANGVVVLENLVQGQGERYIRIRIDKPAVELFLYEDEAQIQGPDIDIRFEAPDFPEQEALIAALFDSLGQLLRS